MYAVVLFFWGIVTLIQKVKLLYESKTMYLQLPGFSDLYQHALLNSSLYMCTYPVVHVQHEDAKGYLVHLTGLSRTI